MATTVIAAGTLLTGELELACNLHLDGQIHGGIRADHAIRVGRDGQIKGEIQAESLTVAGKVEGNIQAKLVEIVEGGLVQGTVHCEELIIGKGGRFFGESKPLKTNITPFKGEEPSQEDLAAQG
ncbi:polymer-forming cytoskeletal protein [Gallaecimonas kandeliae]|uniref:bactofilin family protein n=1 Tax=Gallaecimonas kandeliae TaxID=3029055 RepID=UPI002649DA9A|nr:polymer-forming cytoskeletal protein [Gallaecimonas kandeliae]WKE65771.1 polymer-forming cytoskeletal protein [Gallaecimonas kandeliae]